MAIAGSLAAWADPANSSAPTNAPSAFPPIAPTVPTSRCASPGLKQEIDGLHGVQALDLEDEVRLAVAVDVAHH